MSQAKILSEELGISEIFAHILMRRGYKTVEGAAKFLGLCPQDKLDPFSVHGVKDAVARILSAIDNKENIVIYGDYDVDGVTGGSLYQEYLSRHTDKVCYFIPDRIEDGYGLNNNAVIALSRKGVNLIVTVDNGIGCWEQVELAKTVGVDVIITDHHDLPPRLPDTIVVNPKINSEHPEMAGVGVAFLVCSAIEKLRPTGGIVDLLDLVAVGTIADVAPLIGVNRPLVRAGLKVASKKSRIGLKELIEQNDIFIGGRHELRASHVGFNLGPCLNAAGRLDRADAGVKLLTTKDMAEAKELASKLLDINGKRKEVTETVVARVEKFIVEKQVDTTKAIVYYAKDEHHGVLGIAASRIAEKYSVPALILGYKDGNYVGSCRAPSGFNLFDAINDAKEQGVITGGGGHAAAAGVSVPVDKIEEFYEVINKSLFDAYDPDKKTPFVMDAEVPLSLINDDLIFELDAFQPTGNGNPEVVLLTQDVVVKDIKPFKTGTGFAMTVTDGKLEFRCSAFRMKEELNTLKVGDVIDIAYTPEYNFFPPGKPASIQFRIKKIFH